jgi:hypothetical protein
MAGLIKNTEGVQPVTVAVIAYWRYRSGSPLPEPNISRHPDSQSKHTEKYGQRGESYNDCTFPGRRVLPLFERTRRW